MKRCSLKRNTRPKAIWGTLVSAGLGALGNVIGSYQQAKAQEEQAKLQADLLKQQNDNAIKLQNQMIGLYKQNAENDRIQRNTNNLNEALQMGTLNTKDIYNMNRIVLRKGGKVARRKLRNGNDAIPFRVLRGGEFIPIEVTPDGIFGEFYGKTHEKGGIDVDVNVGNNKKEQIEVEDREGGFIPFDASAALDVLSTRTKNGFNTMHEVRTGRMTPKEAFAVQELNKKIDNKMTYRKSIKRTKAALGLPVYNGFGKRRSGFDYNIYPNRFATKIGDKYYANDIPTINSFGLLTNDSDKYSSYDTLMSGVRANAFGNLAGALATGAGNIASWLIGRRANNKAADYMIDAYKNLRGADLSFLEDGSMNAPKAYASLRSPVISNSNELASIERNRLASNKSINEATRSAAARLNRMAGVNATAQEYVGKSEEQKQRLEEAIKQNNLKEINETSRLNADIASRYATNKLGISADMLKFNTGIANERIMGIGQTNADRYTSNANLAGGALTSTFQGFGNAFRDSQIGYSNAVNAIVGDELEYNRLMATQDPSIQRRLGWTYNNFWRPRRRSLRYGNYGYWS